MWAVDVCVEWHRLRAVVLGLWMFKLGTVSFQEMFLMYLWIVLLMFLVLVHDVLDGFSLCPVII